MIHAHQQRSAWKWSLAVFVVGFTLAFAAGLILNDQVSTDYARYYAPRAHEILAGSGLLDDNGLVHVRYPPGYPLMLAGVFALANVLGLTERLMVTFAAATGLALSTVVLYQIAAHIFGSRPALLTAVTWATYPFALWSAAGGQIEAFYLPFLFGSVYAALRASESGWWAAAAGVLAGLAMLIRPSALGISLILCLWLIVRGRDWRRAAALLTASGLIILPWLVYVYTINGALIPLSTGGTPSIIDGVTFAVRDNAFREQVTLPSGVMRLQTRIFEGVREQNDAPLRAVIAEMSADPASAVQLIAIKAARAWYATDSRRFEAASLFVQLGYLAVSGWAAARILRGHAPMPARPLLALILLIAAYHWLTTIAVLSILRYMLPAMGLLFCLLPALLHSRNSARSAANSASVSPAASLR
jgi:4-amino-4-deoxy-L-arabinose transferase-like glycosyltransferase